MSHPTGFDVEGGDYEPVRNPYGIAGVRAGIDVDGNVVLGAGEFSYGPGNVVPGYEDALPADGGIYRGTAPPSNLHIGVGRQSP